jgi:hypothetical protein
MAKHGHDRYLSLTLTAPNGTSTISDAVQRRYTIDFIISEQDHNVQGSMFLLFPTSII